MELDDDDTSSPAVAEESQKNEEISIVYSSSNNPKEEISILYSSWDNATEFPSFSALHDNQYNLSKEFSNTSLDSQNVFPNECKDDDFVIPENTDDSSKDEISILYSSWDNERRVNGDIQNLEMENDQELADSDSYSDIQILNDTCKHTLHTDFSSQCMPGFSGAGFSFNDFETNDTAQRNMLHDIIRNTASQHQGSVTTYSEENDYQNDFTWPETPVSLQMETDEAGQSVTTSLFPEYIPPQTNARKYPKRVWLRGSQLVIPQHQAKKYQRKSAGNYMNNLQCPPLRRIILSCHICGEIGFHSLDLLYEHQYICERNNSSDPSCSSPSNEGNTSAEDSARSQPTEYRPCPPLKRIIKCDICGEIGFRNLSVLEEHQFNCMANLSLDSDSGSFENDAYKEDVNFEEIMDLNQNRFGSSTEFSNVIPFEQIAKLACSSCGATNFTSMSSLLDHRLHCTNNYAESSAYEQSFATNLTFSGDENQTEMQYNAGQESSNGSELVTPYSEFAQYLDVQPVIQFNCYICGGRGFPSMSDLQKHQDACIKRYKAISKSKLPVENPPPSTKNKVTRQIYKCNLCNTYYEGWTLFGHLLDIHKLLVCLYCFSSFSHADELSVHLFKKHGKEEYFYNSLDHFLATFENGYILVCCRCERMFTEEDRFLGHVCKKKSRIKE